MIWFVLLLLLSAAARLGLARWRAAEPTAPADAAGPEREAVCGGACEMRRGASWPGTFSAKQPDPLGAEAPAARVATARSASAAPNPAAPAARRPFGAGARAIASRKPA